MKPIAREYLLLFNTITDMEETLLRLQERLVSAQQQAEELFLSEDSAAHEETPAAS